MSTLCQTCGAKCCQYFCFQIDEPDDFREFDDLRWYLCHEGISIHIDEGDWYISIENPCKMLTKGNLCSIYEDRPIICREYDPATCDHTGGDYEYDEEFTEPEQLEAYAKKVLGERAYERAKARARAKVDGKTKRKRTRRRPKASSGSPGQRGGSRRKGRGVKRKSKARDRAVRPS